jgi:DNA-binding transcriptional ArsR family regulator
MLKVVFEREDVQRVRLAGKADPMWELILGLQKAQTDELPAPFAGWRQEIAGRVSGRRVESLRLLQTMVRATGSFPDFLTPFQGVSSIAEGCDALLATPPERLSGDLAVTFADRTPSSWVQGLARGERRHVHATANAVHTMYEALISPYWPQVTELFTHEWSRRTRGMAEQGVGAVLGSLPGVLSWDGRVLLTSYPLDKTVHLAGRGLVLLPSHFCWGSPVTWVDPGLPPVLVYQAHGDRSIRTDGLELPAHLVPLLGRTRAECLRLLLVPHTTTELAERLGVSLGAASKQAAVLCAAGLVTSARRGKSVVHQATSLGIALLAGRPTGY